MEELTRVRLRRRCRTLLRDVRLPERFTAQSLCEVVAERRGRRLHLHPMAPFAADEQLPSGMWVATDVADHIFYEQQTSQFHQDHIIFHEIGHILCGHTSPLIAEPPNADTVAQVLNRAGYTTGQEQEAEMVATLLLGRAHTAPGALNETEKRISNALGLAGE